MVETIPFDAAEFLDSPEMIAAYIDVAMSENDPAAIADAFGTVARAIGMTTISKQAGLTREALYKGLSSTGNPTLGTVTGVLNAMGLRLSVVPLDMVDDAGPDGEPGANMAARQAA